MTARVKAMPGSATQDRNRQPGGMFDDGGSGGDDPPMNVRVAQLESDVGHIKQGVAEIKADLRELRRDLSDDFRGARTEIKEQRDAVISHGHGVNAEFKAVREESRAAANALRGEMKADFRVLFGAIISTTIALAGLMAKGFGWF
jgi:hypothetical protein